MAPNDSMLAPTQDAPTPTPAPDNSAAPSTPTPTPAPQPAAAPSAPATAPASALPYSKGSQVHGVLGGVLMGALAGAAKKVGGGIKRTATNFAMNSPRGQELQKNALERQEAQQRMQLQQKQEQRAEETHMDEHTESMLRTNQLALTNMRMVAENQHLETMYPMQEANEKATLMENMDKRDATSRDLLATLEEAGVHIDTSHGPGHAGLTQDHAQAIATGKQIPLSNGKTGDDAGFGFVSNQELENTVLAANANVVSDWKLDPKTGKISPITSTLSAGQNTAMDVLIAHDAGVKKFNELQKQTLDMLDLKAKQADITQKQAEAEKDRAEAKQALMGAGLGNPSLKGDQFLASLPPLQKNQVQGLLRYQFAPADLGRAKDRAVILGATIQADPKAGTPGEWSEAKYKERFNYLGEYGSSSKGDGATRSRINTAIGHLDLLKQAGDALAQNDLPKLNEYANALGVATGNSGPLVYDSIAEKAGGEIAGAVKGGGASATDPALAKAQEHLQNSMSPQQRNDILKAQAAILQTMVGTIGGKFNETMGSTPDEFGQPVLYGGNAERLQSLLAGGNTPPPGATGHAPDPTSGIQWWHDASGKPISRYQGQ